MKNQTTDSPGLTPLGKLIILLFIGGCVAVAWKLMNRDGNDVGANAGSNPSPAGSGGAAVSKATVRIAYGTEKKRWFLWAAEEFAKTTQGANVTLDLVQSDH
jgi:hypothetical protein